MKFFASKRTTILAIDFRRTRIEMVYMKAWPGGFRLLAYETKEVWTNDEADEKSAISFINDFLKNNAIRPQTAILSISDPEAVSIHYLVLPALPKEEILGAAKWQLKEELPSGLENAPADWQFIREYTDEDDIKKTGIVFVAANKTKSDKYLSLLSRCNIHPVAVTSGFLNYANLLQCFSGEHKAVAILDIGNTDSSVGIYINNKLALVRTLPFSLEKLKRSLTGALVSEKGRIELSYEQAAHIIDTFGIPQDEGQVIEDNILGVHIISFMRPFLEGFVRELRFSFDYFASVVDEDPPRVFYLTGEGANLKNLDKYLIKGFNAEASLFSLPACIHTEKFKDELTAAQQNKIMSACGAAARGTESINLLPQEMRTKKRDLFRQISFRMITFLLAVTFLFLLSVLDFRTRDYTKRLSYAQQQLVTIREALTVSQKDVVIERIQKEEVVVDGLLKVISASVPEDILLTEISFLKGNYSLVLKGKAAAKEGASESSLTNLMQQLEASPFFKEASLASSRTSGTTEEFDIRCDLAH